MKAVVWNGPGSTLSLQDIPIPKAGPREIVIRIEASGLCRSDLSIAKGKMPIKK